MLLGRPPAAPGSWTPAASVYLSRSLRPPEGLRALGQSGIAKAGLAQPLLKHPDPPPASPAETAPASPHQDTTCRAPESSPAGETPRDPIHTRRGLLVAGVGLHQVESLGEVPGGPAAEVGGGTGSSSPLINSRGTSERIRRHRSRVRLQSPFCRPGLHVRVPAVQGLGRTSGGGSRRSRPGNREGGTIAPENGTGGR